MSRSKSQLLLGSMLSGKLKPGLIVRELSSGLASNDDQLIFTHARTLETLGKSPTPSAIIESMKREPWSASIIISSLHSYMNQLVSLVRGYDFVNDPMGVAIALMLTGEHYSNSFVESIVPIELLKRWFNLKNVEFHQADGQVWLTSKTNDSTL